MNQTTMQRQEWYEVRDCENSAWNPGTGTTLDEARGRATAYARLYPMHTPFRVIRVTETREEVT